MHVIMYICIWTSLDCIMEEFTLGIDPKSLHATVLMQMVYVRIFDWCLSGKLY